MINSLHILSSVRKTATLIAIFSLLAASAPVGLKTAFAATLYGPTSTTVDNSAEFATTVIDASGYTNLQLSFDFDATSLDATPSPDTFTYGWRSGTDTDIATFVGLSGNNSAEIDSVSVSLPAGAQVSDLQIYIKVTANTDSPGDDVEITNLTVTGDVVSVGPDSVAPPTAPTLSGEVIYDAIPDVLPSSFPSLGYQATQTYEFGDKITFDSGSRNLDSAAVTLTSWACETGQWNDGDCESTLGSTFSHPITLNLYEVDGSGGLGSLIASVTQTFDIPYRPSANSTCADPKQWKDTNDVCSNGYNHVVVFDMTGVTVPDSIIFGIEYNTNTYGDSPIGVSGPYDSLNVGLNSDTDAPYVGTDVDTDEMFWDTTYDSASRGFKAADEWSPYKIAATFTAVPKTSNIIIISGDTSAGENQPGWLFNRDQTTATPFAFDDEEAQIGEGSLHVLPIANDYDGSLGNCKGGVDQTGCNKFIAEYFPLVEMGDFDELSYDFNIGSGGDSSDANEFYLNVYTNFGDSANPTTNFYDCRYNVVPTIGVVGDWTTVTFDPDGSYPVAKWGGSTSVHSCPSTPSDMGPDAIIRAFAVNLGDTSSNDTGVDGYFDNVVYETSDNVTVFDFEPADKEKPTIEVLSPIADYLTNSDFDIEVRATDNRGLAKIVVNLKDGNNSAHLGTCLNQSLDGELEATSSCTVDISSLGEGPFYFRTNSKDEDDNLSNTISQRFIIDTTGPTITVKDTSSGSNDVFTNVSFKLFDEYKVDKLTLNGVEKNLTDNKWSDLNNVKPGSFGAVEGENTLVVYDVAGNSTTYVFTLVVDDVGPTITIKPSSVGTPDTFFEVSFEFFDEYLVDKLTLNGVEKDLTNSQTSDLDYVSPGSFGAVEGENTLVVYDVAGNSTTYVFYLIVDTTKPNVTIISPLDGAILPTGDILVTGTSSDADSDIEEVKYTVTQIDGIGGSYVANIDSGVASGTEDWEFEIDLDTPGFYRIKVQAFDEYGNWRYKYHDIEVRELLACTLYSDTDTVVVENNDFAVATWTHNNWTAVIPGATWIWETFFVQDPETTTTKTFKETFSVTDFTDATLYLASDNTFKVYINDALVYEGNNSNNFQTFSQKEFTDVADYLVGGENTLEIEVTNPGKEDTIAKTNPAGLLYKLVVNTAGGSCNISTDVEPPATYEVFGYAWDDNNEDGVKGVDEPYLSGVSVSITNGTSTNATSTDSNGYYYFVVEDGDWTTSASLTDWFLTYPGTTDNSHSVTVSGTSTGPYDFGLSDDVESTTSTGGSGGGGGGGSSSGGGTPTVLGASTGNEELNDLLEEIKDRLYELLLASYTEGQSPQPGGSVLGASASQSSNGSEEQNDSDDNTATTTEEKMDDEGGVVEAAVNAIEENDWCKYFWLLIALWLVVSAGAYWRQNVVTDSPVMRYTQLLFGLLALALLIGTFVTSLDCAFWPALITAAGSAFWFWSVKGE